MPTRRRPLTDSPFDTLERTFTLLVDRAQPARPRRAPASPDCPTDRSPSAS